MDLTLGGLDCPVRMGPVKSDNCSNRIIQGAYGAVVTVALYKIGAEILLHLIEQPITACLDWLG